MTATHPETTTIGASLEISRILTGLWQVADMERGGAALDPEAGADALQAYADAGFTSFDMADHYGSAEIITGRLLQRYQGDSTRPGPKPRAFTKWCPEPGAMTADVVRAGVQARLERLGVRQVDLLQFHWWTFEHPAWLDALHELAELRERGLIAEIGVTNFDAAHLHLALADGIPVRTNQISFSLLDRRAAGALSDVCEAGGVRLLAYGTLAGGFLSAGWLGKPEPEVVPDWSGMKYHRFIQAIGGWDVYQGILAAAARIGEKHAVSIANVATRWVLDQAAVAGVIIGARLGEREHRADNLKLFGFALDAEDRAMLVEAFSKAQTIPGDCGDEYRKPPFLTASGDLSHHLSEVEKPYRAEKIPGREDAEWVLSGSEWEDVAGYCRARRVGDRIVVSGTTATAGVERAVAAGDAAAQTTFILDKIAASLAALGGTMEDVIRTRIYLTDERDALAVSKAHGRVFGDIKPANTLLCAGALIGDYKVEIEAEAVVSSC